MAHLFTLWLMASLNIAKEWGHLANLYILRTRRGVPFAKNNKTIASF
jgi:hypothetical protein